MVEELEIEESVVEEQAIDEEVESYVENIESDGRFIEEPVADEAADKKDKKSKKEKVGLFSRKKAAPEVDEIPDDLKPISWADLKNKE